MALTTSVWSSFWMRFTHENRLTSYCARYSLHIHVESLEIWIIATNRFTSAVTGTRSKFHPSTCLFSGKHFWLIVSHLQCEIFFFSGKDMSARAVHMRWDRSEGRKKKIENKCWKVQTTLNAKYAKCKMNSNPVSKESKIKRYKVRC